MDGTDLTYLVVLLIALAILYLRCAIAIWCGPIEPSTTDIEVAQQQQRRQDFVSIERVVIGVIQPPKSAEHVIRITEWCTECAICLGDYESDEYGVLRTTLKPCGHRFHKLCIDAWFENGPKCCPICRGVSQDSSDSVSSRVS